MLLRDAGASALDLGELGLQKNLTALNRLRLHPTLPPSSGPDFETEAAQRRAEADFLARERAAVRRWIPADLATRSAGDFIEWFGSLREWAPGQRDPLFPWLAEEASVGEMRWFIAQEVAGEAGFDDLVALTQVKMPVHVKLELARNYWDEMGRGKAAGMHGPMLARLAEEMGVGPDDATETLAEPLALGNLMAGLASNRAYAYHSLGCLGAVELTAPERAQAVASGLKRLGISSVGQRYYKLHAALDVQHAKTWCEEALLPLVHERRECAVAIAEGALMRLQAGARCFDRYRRHFSPTK